ncbi:hypothetical protein A0H81_00975 [Grifola frondosa]|uniref:Uncharacterized protein n=1 Tax=Grifola frondosa TaxID=5627 RepID=A0A1C7MU91_GRIFR|nr:hypothetical protein A0H81_00975 [Grifola frondosa]
MTTLDISGKYMMNKSLGDDPTRSFASKVWAGLRARQSQWRQYISSTASLIGPNALTTTTSSGQCFREAGVSTWKKLRGTGSRVVGRMTPRSMVSSTHTRERHAEERTSWSMDQTWGFEEVKGEGRYVRHLFFTGPKSELIEARLVYDYQGGL